MYEADVLKVSDLVLARPYVDHSILVTVQS